MSQNWPAINGGDAADVQKLVEKLETLRSGSSGTSFPATAVVGQRVVRTDESKEYICTNATGPVFVEFFSWLLASLSGVVTYADIQNVSGSNKLLGRITGAGAMEEIGLGTGLSFSGSNLAINVATALGFTPLDSATYTAADILAKLITVDGAASGLDAQLFAGAALSLDGTFNNNSDTRVPSEKAIRTYLDNALTGLRWKPSVRVATVAAGTLASSFENGDTVDGVVVATGDRILIKNQVAGAENGIYVVAASGAPTRATDMDTSAEALQATCFVQEGTANADTQWTCTTGSITLGTTALVFAQVSGAGTYTVSGGLTLTGNAFSITTNGISNALLRQGAALSIIGVTGNATANVADIAAANDGEVLRRSGTTLGFGTVAAAGIASNAVTTAKILDANVTLAKLASIGANRILGSVAGGTPAELTAAQVKTLIAIVQADITGLASSDSPQFAGVNLGHATDTTLTRLAAGVLGIEGKAAARVNSGNAANSGLISWGTAAPGTLDEGQIYLRHA